MKILLQIVLALSLTISLQAGATLKEDKEKLSKEYRTLNVKIASLYFKHSLNTDPRAMEKINTHSKSLEALHREKQKHPELVQLEEKAYAAYAKHFEMLDAGDKAAAKVAKKEMDELELKRTKMIAELPAVHKLHLESEANGRASFKMRDVLVAELNPEAKATVDRFRLVKTKITAIEKEMKKDAPDKSR